MKHTHCIMNMPTAQQMMEHAYITTLTCGGGLTTTHVYLYSKFNELTPHPKRKSYEHQTSHALLPKKNRMTWKSVKKLK